LKAVLRRRNAATQRPLPRLSAGKLQLIPAKRELRFDDKLFVLTAAEFDLLETLLRNGDIVSTKDELSWAVLGRARQPYDRSVDVHVSNLRKKLHVVSDATIEVESVRSVGYRLKVLR
jgi:two-component system OmpR family response regulator